MGLGFQIIFRVRAYANRPVYNSDLASLEISVALYLTPNNKQTNKKAHSGYTIVVLILQIYHFVKY